MKTLLVGINAKYIHSNLGIRYIKEYAKKENIGIDIAEFTINQSIDYIMGEIYRLNPDVLGFSCYIWNIEMIKQLVVEIKKLMPNVCIVLGGPEVSYESEKIIKNNRGIDIIVYGEGEKTFSQLLKSNLVDENLKKINGITYATGNEIIINPEQEAMDLDELPFVYHEGFEKLNNRILYYETTRGCPFMCEYCLSSIDKKVRFRSFELTKKDLKVFLENKVMQVKFVDRTFNCKKEHAMNIWRYLCENDNGITNFHFEISADILDDEMIEFVSQARAGLFQFEIGVQSTNEETLQEINRETKVTKIKENVTKLKKSGNIHLHLDLIAGLPKENAFSFSESFNEVYKMGPEKLQIGFLKVLNGSGIKNRSKNLGIVYRDFAPYEVLHTKEISYLELLKLKEIEELVDVYYNSGNYKTTIKYIEQFYDSPYDMYKKLSEYYSVNGYYQINISKTKKYDILYNFAIANRELDKEFLKELMVFDMYCLEKVKKFPENINIKSAYTNEIIDFYKSEDNINKYMPNFKEYTSKQISRMTHIEKFKYNIIQYIESDYSIIIKENINILFKYDEKDLINNKGKYRQVSLWEREV